jgi:hypothetical protein
MRIRKVANTSWLPLDSAQYDIWLNRRNQLNQLNRELGNCPEPQASCLIPNITN